MGLMRSAGSVLLCKYCNGLAFGHHMPCFDCEELLMNSCRASSLC